VEGGGGGGVEEGGRAVGGEGHDGVRWCPAADQVPDVAPPQVVHDATRETELRADFRPELSEVPDSAAVPVEDVWAVKSAGLPAARDDRGEFAAVDWDDAAVPALAA